MPTSKPPLTGNLKRALEIAAQIEKLQDQIAMLLGEQIDLGDTSASRTPTKSGYHSRTKRGLSNEERARIAAALLVKTPAGSTKSHRKLSREERFQRAEEKVFSEHRELLHRLAQ